MQLIKNNFKMSQNNTKIKDRLDKFTKWGKKNKDLK